MKKNYFNHIVVSILILLFFCPSLTFGQSAVNVGLLEAGTFGLPNVDLITFISRLVRIFLSLIVLIAVLLIILSGFRWMVAGGDEEKIKKARSALFNAIIGLILVLSSYAIVSFVISVLINATSV
ncbi:MAG: hypothetical protein WCV92_01310 [Candidatus Buchananbacteria bacterium]